jgi:hypothetical protein
MGTAERVLAPMLTLFATLEAVLEMKLAIQGALERSMIVMDVDQAALRKMVTTVLRQVLRREQSK